MRTDSPRTRVTTRDIAERLGLSRTTVCIVLRGEAEKRNISPRTAQRVLDTARELNYVPNNWARNLRRQRSGMIGVLLVNFRWDWADMLVTGLSRPLVAGGYTPFVAVHHFDSQGVRRELQSCIERRDEGVIMQPMPGLTDLYDGLQERGIPLVFIGDYPADMPQASFAAWDSAPDARLAVAHLLATGRRRIGFLGYEYAMPLNQARFDEYLRVLHEAGLPPEEHWIARPPLDWSFERMMEWSVQRMFRSGGAPPDGILALNDGLAVPLLDELARAGIRVPEDVGVVGMGDYPITRHAGISLSTVREPVTEMGQAAAEAIMRLLSEPAAGPVQRLLPCARLYARRTTAVAAPDAGGQGLETPA